MGIEVNDPTQTAVVFVAGDPIDPTQLPPIPAGAFTIAADGGIAQAERIGVPVHILIGDMDSATVESIERARAAGAAIERHPADKDETDLELAIDRAVAAGYRRIVVIGGRGGRLDHLLGNALLLHSAGLLGIEIEWWTGSEYVTTARRGAPVVIVGTIGDLVSLIPIREAASGVTTEGLRWILTGESLGVGSTLGISNEMTASRARISVDDGALLVLHSPGER